MLIPVAKNSEPRSDRAFEDAIGRRVALPLRALGLGDACRERRDLSACREGARPFPQHFGIRHAQVVSRLMTGSSAITVSNLVSTRESSSLRTTITFRTGESISSS